jgi:hypothetical protein
MNRPILICTVVLSLFLVITPFDALTQNSEPPTIVVSEVKAPARTISFTPHELRRIESNPRYVLTKLGPDTEKRCVYPRRVSSCIWSCSGGTKVRTCNGVIVRALESFWGK